MTNDRKLGGSRVYATFLPDETIVVHPSNCTGRNYRRQHEGSVHLSRNITPEELGKAVMQAREKCTLPSE